MKTKSFRDLIVWQKAYKLTLDIYRITVGFPKEERYGIISQMRRAAVSISSNISEGYSRQHKLEYKQFLSVAYGSLSELQTQLLISKDLRYLAEADYNVLAVLINEVGAMLYRMIHPIRYPLTIENKED